MNVKRLCLENVGLIRKAETELADLTVLMVPQATGKTVFLEFLKPVSDAGHIHSELTKHGFDWNGDRCKFLAIYPGKGMQTFRTDESAMTMNRGWGRILTINY